MVEDIPIPEKTFDITSVFRDDIKVINAIKGQPPNWCSGKKKIPQHFYQSYSKDKIESMRQYFIVTANNNINDIHAINNVILSAFRERFLLSSDEDAFIKKCASEETPYYLLAYAWYQAVVTYKSTQVSDGRNKLKFDATKKAHLVAVPIETQLENNSNSFLPITGIDEIKNMVVTDLDGAFNKISQWIPEADQAYNNLILLWGKHSDFKSFFNGEKEISSVASSERRKIVEELTRLIGWTSESFPIRNKTKQSRENYITHKRAQIKNMIATDLDESLTVITSIVPPTLSLSAPLMAITSDYNMIKVSSRNQDYTSLVEAHRNVRQELINFLSLVPPKQFGNAHSVAETSELGDPVVFYTQDESPEEYSLPNLLEGAQKVHVSARTAVGLLSAYVQEFVDLLNGGCDLRFLILDEDAEASRRAYTDIDTFKRNSSQTKQCIDRIMRMCKDNPFENCGDIETRITDEFLTSSLLFIERENEGLIVVQIYFAESRSRQNRPLFILDTNHKWFGAYKSELETLWHKSKPLEQYTMLKENQKHA